MFSTKRVVFCLAMAGFILLSLASYGLAAPKLLWTYGTSSKSSGYYTIHVLLAQMINKYVPEVSCTPIETGATVDNLVRMGNNEVQIAFGAEPASWLAMHGEGPYEGKPVKTSRTLWNDFWTTYNYVVHAESGLKTFRDLNGKRVNIGIPGSTTQELSEWAFKVLGVRPKDMIRSSTGDAIEMMQNRKIDAWNKGCANPDSAIVSLGATVPISILNFSDEDIAKLKEDRPYMRGVVIEGNMYKNTPQFQTFAHLVGIVIRADVPQELQYKIVKALYEHWDEFLTSFPQYRKSPDPLKLTAQDTVTPLAAGTVQYLQEKGYSVPEKVIPSEFKKK